MINNFLSNTKIAIVLAREDNRANIFFACWMQIVNRGINQFSQTFHAFKLIIVFLISAFITGVRMIIFS